jgi:hypothetical protein
LTRTTLEIQIVFSMKFACAVLFSFSLFLHSTHLNAIYEGKHLKVSSSATLKATYDSKVFAMPTNDFNTIRESNSSGITASELKSEDDFIISFSPALHFSSKLGLLKISGSAGVNISQYVLNDDKSNIVPTTSLSVDFDDTLALKKRISNNAKIRFESTFDVGQVVGASVLDQDLVSYTYITSGLNVRYNHSDKFGLGGGTSYSYRFYQTDSNSRDQPNFDFSTLPLSARAFYIYSEKLDFFTTYSFSRSKADSGNRNELTSSRSHSISVGADGQFSPKLTGTASIGYSLLDFDYENTPNRHNIITTLNLNWKYNSKTSSDYSISRSISPTATGQSTISTTIRTGVNHRFTDTWSGTAYVSSSLTDYIALNAGAINEYSSKNHGAGINFSKSLSNVFNASSGYDISYTSSLGNSFFRHVIYAQLTGRF